MTEGDPGGYRMLFIPSAIALTLSLHLVRFAASSTSKPILFALSLTSPIYLAFLAFAAHPLQASMLSLERYHLKRYEITSLHLQEL